MKGCFASLPVLPNLRATGTARISVALLGSSRLWRTRHQVRNRRHRPAWVALLSGVAAVANLAVLPLAFGIQFLPGSLLAVLGVLLFGGWGIPIGVIASLVTIHLWGHPWAVLIFSGEIIWLHLYLLICQGLNSRRDRRRPNHPSFARRKDDGGIILADISFWLLIGIPMVIVFYGFTLRLDSASVTAVALKQAVNGVINAALGFVLYLLIRSRIPGPDEGHGLSILGVSFSAILMAITIPSLAITKVISQQLEHAAEHGESVKLQMVSHSILALPLDNLHAMALSLTGDRSRIAISRWDQGRLVYCSDPILFDRLRQDYRPAAQGEIQIRNQPFGLLIHRHEQALLKTWLGGFWLHDQSRTRSGVHQRVLVVEPARDLVVELQRQSSQLIGMLAGVVLIGALISELLGRLIAAQFMLVLNPGRRRAGQRDVLATSASELRQPIPMLSETLISELNSMVRLINNRIANNNRLTQALRRSNQKLAASKQELEKLSTTDPLTGCFNRRELQRRLNEEIQRSNRSGVPLSCLCIDVDHFKAINDSYGHPIGDEVLRHLADTIGGRIRSTDCLCRSGGEEFTLLLSCCDRQAALSLAEQLRGSIASLRIRAENDWITVTISIGVAAYRPTQDLPESLLRRADRALYRAKAAGRNRVEGD